MKPCRFLAPGVAAMFAVVACQSVPPGSNNVPEETTAATADAASATDRQGERPRADTPRAEGEQLAEFIASTDVLFLDVRRPDEIEELGTVEGYLNIPIEELAERLDEVPRTKPILTA